MGRRFRRLPFEGSRTRCDVPCPVARTRWPLVRLAALQSVVNTGSAGLSGSPRPRRRRGFPPVPVAPHPVSSPASLRKRVHPLVSSASSSEFEPLRTCPSHGCEERLPWGLPSQSRHQLRRSTCERGSQPRPTFRPRRFARPRRLTLSTTLRACFIPLPRPGFTFQGFVPTAWPGRLVDDPCPPVVDHPLLPSSCLGGSRSGDLAFRALIRAAIRSDRPGV
jgi:hypothetical protein